MELLDRLVTLRVEHLAHGLELLDVVPLQGPEQLLVDHVHAIAQRGRLPLHVLHMLQGALHVVRDAEEIQHHPLLALPHPIAHIAAGALLVILELGGGAQEPILEPGVVLHQPGHHGAQGRCGARWRCVLCGRALLCLLVVRLRGSLLGLLGLLGPGLNAGLLSGVAGGHLESYSSSTLSDIISASGVLGKANHEENCPLEPPRCWPRDPQPRARNSVSRSAVKSTSGTTNG